MSRAGGPEVWPKHRLLRVLLILAALASGCRDEAGGVDLPLAPRPPPVERADLLVVTIDTARADRFSHLADSPVRTASVDGVAAEGAAFGQAISPVPVTLPAHASLFTGRNPPSHAVRSNGVYFLSETEQTLAEVLKQAGYSTAAFVGAAVLDARYGLDQGFDHYDDRVDLTDQASGLGAYAQRRGEDVVAAALRWLAGVPEQATFVWIHLFDPHVPYLPPEPERHRHPESLYDGEIAYADRVIGVLLEGYEKLGRYRDAVVVITADHGEGLGQHGESTHGLFVYDTTLRVPLVIKGPGVPAGVRVDRPVSLIDVVPTVCALLAVPPPDALDGRSLLPLIEGRDEVAGERWIYFESLYPYVHYGWADYRGIRSTAWKLIEGRSKQLYRVGVEPDEKLDLAATRPETVAALSAQLSRVIAGEKGIAASRMRLDAESRRELAALGYAQGGLEAEAGPRSERPDPRERIHVLEAFDRAVAVFTRGERARGLALAEEAARAAPESAAFARRLAHMYRLEERREQALAEYRRALELDPRDVDSWSSLGGILQGLGRNREAIVAYERAIALQPRDRNSRHNRWSLLLDEGRKEEVAEEASLAIEREPGDGEAHWASVMARYGAASPPELIAALERALRLAPDDPTLALELAIRLNEQGEAERAEALYRQVWAEGKAHRKTAFHLGRLLVKQQRWSEARPIVEAELQAGRSAELLLLLSEIRFMTGDRRGALESAREVVHLAPDRADAWRTLADLEADQGQLEAAAASYRRAIELGHDDPRTRQRLAALYQRMGSSPETGAGGRRRP